MQKKLFSFILLILICSCSSKEAIQDQYYLLSSGKLPTNEKLPEKMLKVTLSNIPDYLKQSQLVLVDEDNRMIVANNHHWAEGVETSIKRLLKTEMNRYQKERTAIFQCRSCDELQVYIDHFYATTNGVVLLTGSYRYIPLKGKELTSPFTFKQDIKEDGYLETVKVMSNLLVELSKKLASKFSSTGMHD